MVKFFTSLFVVLGLIASIQGSCSVSSSLVARPGAWVANGVPNTIYDIKITNKDASCPITSLIAQLGLGSCTVSNAWNIDVRNGVISGYGSSLTSSYNDAGLILVGNCQPTITVSASCSTCPSNGQPTNPPTSRPPTSPPPTSRPPTSRPPTSPPPTSRPPTSRPPTSSPPTSRPPTSRPPTSSPPTSRPPTSSPTVPPTSAPTPVTLPEGTCDVVLVIDNYLVQSTGLSAADLRARYTDYFADVNTYYKHYFNLNMDLPYVYVEESAPFSTTDDDGILLTDFANAIRQGRFPGMPANACVHHLLTGRILSRGGAGLAWVGTACDNSANLQSTSLVMDAQGRDDSELVIRRIIHEIGHNLGGNHPDAYGQSDPRYTCSTNEDMADYRILRSAMASPMDTQVYAHDLVNYKYMQPQVFISDCATFAIKARLASFSCLWTGVSTNVPDVIFYDDVNFGGNSYTLRAYQGTSPSQCYNILPFNDRASAFQVVGDSVTSIRVYEDIDCLGSSTTYNSQDITDMGAFSDAVTSFTFL